MSQHLARFLILIFLACKASRPIDVQQSERRGEDSGRPSGLGFSLFLGADIGPAFTNAARSSNESSKSGLHAAAKALGSVYSSSIALDFGGGYFLNRLSGARDELPETETPSGQPEPIQNVRAETMAGFAEFSPRLRIGENFQVGPVAQVYFGPDVTFGAGTSGRTPTALGGLQLNFLTGEQVAFRLGAQFLTDINIAPRNVYLALLNLQLGLPIVRPKTILHERETRTLNENVLTQQVDKPITKIIVKDVVRILFEGEVVNFTTGSAVLSADSARFLAEVGAFLRQEADLWTDLTIEGHTDIRGGYDYNMKLSRDRAASVREALINSGLPPERMKSVGYGYTRPLDAAGTEVALARNRRVEMNFVGVRDARRLRDEIERIRTRYQK